MSDVLFSVEAVAERLKLHPKTVLRFIRDGRLKATKVGRAYRIRRSDIEALAGAPLNGDGAQEVQVTSVVDVPDVEPEVAKRLARAVPAALRSRPRGGAPMRADVIFEPDRGRLKIILLGALGDTADLLRMIRVWLS